MQVTLASEEILGMDYVSFTAFLRETNRPPGGKHSVRLIAHNAFLSPEKYVLEVGCNTGFTSIELAKTAGCRVMGIDVSHAAVSVARKQSKAEGCGDRVFFRVADACTLPFGEEQFDAVVTGGANAWISDRSKALTEYWRVLKDWGFLCTVPFYYRTQPPDALIASLNERLGIEIEKWDRRFWCNLFESGGYEPYFLQPEVPATVVSGEALADHAHYMACRVVSPDKADLLAAVEQKVLSYWQLFNENNRYLAFSVMVYRKRCVPSERTIFD